MRQFDALTSLLFLRSPVVRVVIIFLLLLLLTLNVFSLLALHPVQALLVRGHPDAVAQKAGKTLKITARGYAGRVTGFSGT